MSPTSDFQQGVRHEPPFAGFASGPARFVTTNDGSRDCLALLVTETFLEKLNDMFQCERDLNTIQGPVNTANMDIKSIEYSIERAKKSLESSENKAEKEEIRQYLDHQQPRLLKICQRKQEIEEQCFVLKREISRSSSYAHYVLNSAMESANLLRQREALPYPRIDSGEPIQFPSRQPVISQSRPKPSPSPEELRRQAAFEELEDCWHHLDKIQRFFNGREQLYHQDLAEYQQKCADGRCSLSQSEFDRRHVEYGMRLTGILIDAESSFERAKERVEVFEEASSRDDSSYDHRYDEKVPREQVQAPAPMLNRGFIEAWRADVSGPGADENLEMATTDAVDAELVDISDSMSARDCSEYRKKIDRWQQACGTHQSSKRRRTREVWTRNDDLWRRHSA